MDELMKELCDNLDSTRKRLDSVIDRLDESGTLIQAVSDAEKKLKDAEDNLAETGGKLCESTVNNLAETGGKLRESTVSIRSAAKELGELAQNTTQVHKDLHEFAKSMSDNVFKEFRDRLLSISDQMPALQELKKSLSETQDSIDRFHEHDAGKLDQIDDLCKKIKIETNNSGSGQRSGFEKTESSFAGIREKIESFHESGEAKLNEISDAIVKIREICDRLTKNVATSSSEIGTDLRKAKDEIVGAVNDTYSKSDAKNFERKIVDQMNDHASKANACVTQEADKVSKTMQEIDNNLRSEVKESGRGMSDRIDEKAKDTNSKVLQEAQKIQKYVVTSSVAVILLLSAALSAAVWYIVHGS